MSALVSTVTWQEGSATGNRSLPITCPGISLKLHTIIYIPEVMRNNVFPETSSLLSPVALAILQHVLEPWSLSRRTEPSAVDIQPPPASFSSWAQNKDCNIIAWDVWKTGWLMLHAQKINRFGHVSSVIQVFLGTECIPKCFYFKLSLRDPVKSHCKIFCSVICVT